MEEEEEEFATAGKIFLEIIEFSSLVNVGFHTHTHTHAFFSEGLLIPVGLMEPVCCMAIISESVDVCIFQTLSES